MFYLKPHNEPLFESESLAAVSAEYVAYCARHSGVRHASAHLYKDGTTHKDVIGFVRATDGAIYGEPVRPMLYQRPKVGAGVTWRNTTVVEKHHGEILKVSPSGDRIQIKWDDGEISTSSLAPETGITLDEV